MTDAERVREIFSHYFEVNWWGSPHSVSGPGSDEKSTRKIRRGIPALFDRLGVQSILDAPCGDFNWFQLIDWKEAIDYTGADVVEALVHRNNTRYGGELTRFISLDIIRDPLPKADLWLCRDCWLHLSNADILAVIANFAASEIRYLLVSTYVGIGENHDIPTGSGRFYDLRLPPFNLAPPIEIIDDSVSGAFVKHLGLWERDSVRASIESNQSINCEGV